jgi:hypothetical protein
MRLLLTIVSLLTISLTLFAAGEGVITHTKACVKVKASGFETCSSTSVDDGGVRTNGFEINTASAKLKIQSNESYEGVNSSDLLAGLEKAGKQGISVEIAAFIAGPVVYAMEEAVNNPNEDTISELAAIKLRLAKKISKL